MIVEGFICLQYFEMYLYKFGKMTDKNKENRFTIKTRIFNCKHLKKKLKLDGLINGFIMLVV